ncbi:uncharacterized protein AMSG_03635 [Thecamonas trahens ATCC 50062]|uniref:Uncharacterized protein n=1 Tax=Thecamonas trahens ATCC 50062 TaxID=461836 RepID=A0A0L0D4B3_THETB|nr:hypothetical protein AMSG_03635 [Thecamonas trahens ATCC 50062]KNC47207.1 hypothetical protein AMSG_03635 [Thecamonas trahens ATCC 50062]|eukprot:XP_013759976.1 hypothetical protein AMSG_03635 [Thecamonas trahens ATCC 50062]
MRKTAGIGSPLLPSLLAPTPRRLGRQTSTPPRGATCNHCVGLGWVASASGAGARSGRGRGRGRGRGGRWVLYRERRPFTVNYTGSRLEDNRYVSVFDEHMVSHYHKPRVRDFFVRNALVDETFAELGGVYRKALSSASATATATAGTTRLHQTARESESHSHSQSHAPRPPSAPRDSASAASRGRASRPRTRTRTRPGSASITPLVLSPEERALTGDQVKLLLSEEEYTRIRTVMRNFG